MNTAGLRIDIVSDVVCPWCAIGYHRLLRAIESTDASAQIHWHPFELNPQMPEGGQNLREHLAQKYGTTPEGSVAARERLTSLAADVGFSFDYFDEMRTFNTFRAHQLLHWAGTIGDQTPLAVALFAAFFSRRESLDETDVLTDAAQRAGLNKHEAEAVLVDGRFAEAVRTNERFWLDRGIRGVPAFVFNERYLVTGAREPERFAELLVRMQAEASRSQPELMD